MPTGRRPTPATPRSRTAPSTCTKRPTRDTSRVGTGRESGTLGDPRAPHVAAGESRRDRAMRAGRVPRMPRWLRQPRHAGRAWYYPFTLASGSDPRHESRVALLASEPLHERGLLVAHLARQPLAELLEELLLRGRRFEPPTAIDREEVLERRARDVEAGEVDVGRTGEIADRGLHRIRLPVHARDDPAQHAQVLAEPGPD